MPAGQLRNRVTIQKPVASTNSYGEAVPSWSDFCDVWAEIVVVAGTERFDNQRVAEDITHRVTIRWVDGINSSYRLKRDSRIYNIVSIDEQLDRPKSYLVLGCREDR
jgi:SPP1 family predicted phage head-tail adaptor